MLVQLFKTERQVWSWDKQFNWAERGTFAVTTEVNINFGTLWNYDGVGNGNAENTTDLGSKTTTRTCITHVCKFLWSVSKYNFDEKWLNFKFPWERERWRRWILLWPASVSNPAVPLLSAPATLPFFWVTARLVIMAKTEYERVRSLFFSDIFIGIIAVALKKSDLNLRTIGVDNGQIVWSLLGQTL